MNWYGAAALVFFLLGGFAAWIIYKKILFWNIAASAGISLFVYFFYQSYPVMLFLALMTLHFILFVADMQDIRDCYVYDWQLVAIALAVLLVLLAYHPNWLLSVAAGALAFVLLIVPYAVTRGKGMGLGDPIVFGLTGLIVTPVEIIPLFLMVSLSALTWGIGRYLIRGEKTLFPLIPFIHLSLLVFLPFSRPIMELLGLYSLYLMQFV